MGKYKGMKELAKRVYNSKKLGDEVEYYRLPNNGGIMTLLGTAEGDPTVSHVLVFENFKAFKDFADDLREA